MLKKIFIFLILINSINLILLKNFPSSVWAGPQSTTYELKQYGFGSGGTENSTSTTYGMFSTSGETDNGSLNSTTYTSGNGLIYTIISNVPPAPTFTNPSSYYNKLKLVLDAGNNPSDTVFAIAISADNFVADTRYVQADTTPGSSAVWQTYTSWGGATGFNITQLIPGTTYYVKVSAMQGGYSQSIYGPTASVATSDPSLTFTIAGVNSGTTIAGVSTDITTTSTAASFGTLPFNQDKEAASLLTVSTNAVSGYTITVAQTGAMLNENSITFPAVSGTNSSPAIFPASVTTGAYGYHTTDGTLGTGTTTRFSSNNTYAQFDSTAREIAFDSAPVTSQTTNIVYEIEAGFGQQPGSYSHTITYLATGIF